MGFSMCTREGRSPRRMSQGLTSLLILFVSGQANDTAFRDGFSVDPDAEMTDIDPNTMETTTGDAFQGDVTDADTSQGNATEANAICSDASDEDGYNDEVAFEEDLLDAEALETGSQGKKLDSN